MQNLTAFKMTFKMMIIKKISKRIVLLTLLLVIMMGQLYSQPQYTYLELINSRENIYNIDSDTIGIIKELLKAKGDTRPNYIWCGFTDTLKQEISLSSYSTLCIYYGRETNQVIALYLIELLIRGKGNSITYITLLKKIGSEYDYCSNLEEEYVFDRKTGWCLEDFKIVNSSEYEEVYSLYENWLKEAEDIGLNAMRKKQPNPLNNSGYKWEDDAE